MLDLSLVDGQFRQKGHGQAPVSEQWGLACMLTKKGCSATPRRRPRQDDRPAAGSRRLSGVKRNLPRYPWRQPFNHAHSDGCSPYAFLSGYPFAMSRFKLLRFGGDDFVLLLCTPRSSGPKASERIRMQAEIHQIGHGGRPLLTTASFGAAATSDDGCNLGGLGAAADRASYTAKNAWSQPGCVHRLRISCLSIAHPMNRFQSRSRLDFATINYKHACLSAG
jgi:hypothetical protein